MFGSKSFKLPKDIEVIEFQDRLRFKGTANQIDQLALEIQQLSTLKNDQKVKLGDYSFVISDIVPILPKRGIIQLPNHAWNIMASKFSEVANNWEDSPFDFNDCGYINPKLDFDIGVELIGEPNPR